MKRDLIFKFVIGLLIIILLGSTILLTLFSNQAEKKEMSVVLVENEVDGDLTGRLSLKVKNYGIIGNNVWVKGEIKYVGKSNECENGDTPEVLLSIKKIKNRKIEIGVYLYKGHWWWFTGPINIAAKMIPPLGGTETSCPPNFNYSLSCNY